MSFALCPIIRGHIIQQWKEGKSEEEIAANIPCSQRTVHKWITRFIEGGDRALHNRRPQRTTQQAISYKNLCPEERGRIIEQWKAGKSEAQIAVNIPCSEKTVRRWIKRFSEGGDHALHDHRKHNHRPRQTTKQQDQEIVDSIRQRPFSTIAEAIRSSGVSMSDSTARRRLHEAGYYCYRLTHRNAQTSNEEQRVAFALENLMTTREEWEVTIWTGIKVFVPSADDQSYLQEVSEEKFNPNNVPHVQELSEEKFNPNNVPYVQELSEEKFNPNNVPHVQELSEEKFNPNNVPYVQELSEEKFNPNNVVATHISERISCTMWGWFSSGAIGEFIDIPSTMNSEEYISIMEEVLLPSVRAIYPVEEVPIIRVVQDNSDVHTSREIQEWFQNHQEIRLIKLPDRSPDLNLMEDVWEQMIQHWEQRGENTVAALVDHAREVWEELRSLPNFFAALLDSIPDRLHNVIKHTGSLTD
ncbi:PREDICTED: uncharacterized protein LOC105564120 [Vollenhovia emeryi]|uniref:uncharacterized protein LOC105564120 n=1 Tax=Vollenhovia emeryi TaxID=411798 RepID=UPI0005F3EFF8|nr:PREDICTED: uncharacterized protein LOC105564120 [Vollenhovia emeryi]